MNISQLDYQRGTLPLFDVARWRAEYQPDRHAFTFQSRGGDLRLTYAELDHRARIIGAWLQDQGAVNQPVLLLHPPSLDYISAFFGCLYAGAIAVPAYPPHSARTLPRIQSIVEDTQASIVLTTTETFVNLQRSFPSIPGAQRLNWIATDALDESLAEAWQEPKIELHDIAFLQYTSGSTGTSKGVMVTHGNIFHNLSVIAHHLGQTEESHIVSWLPPYHDLGLIGGILYPLHRGFPSTLMSPVSFLQRPFRWLQTISDIRATMSMAPNFAFDLCCRKITPEQRATLDLSSWEVAVNGGEPVREETLVRFTETFAPCGFRHETHFPGYGMAEATLLLATPYKLSGPTVRAFQQEALEQHDVVEIDRYEADAKTIIGYPHVSPDQRVFIVDPETLCVCPPGQIGEIWCTGPSVTKGYWRKEGETRDTFHAYTSDTHEGPFLRTGDLGFLHEGILFVTGRLKDLIIIHGLNYYPQDIEYTVEACHPAIRASGTAAFSLDAAGTEQLVILAEIDPRYKPSRGFPTEQEERGTSRQPLNPQEVISAISAAVAEAHELQAHRILLVKAGSVLKTSSGKLQRRACRSKFLAGTLEVWDE